jgi:hypothetical protein
MLCAMLNIPQPTTSFSIYNKTTGSAVNDVGEFSMMQAAREAVAQNEEDEPSPITVCFDGTWQKCGHTFLNGIISSTSFNKGKVSGMEIMTRFCFVCQTTLKPPNMSVKKLRRNKNGLEGAHVLNIFNCCVHTQGIGIC